MPTQREGFRVLANPKKCCASHSNANVVEAISIDIHHDLVAAGALPDPNIGDKVNKLVLGPLFTPPWPRRATFPSTTC